MTPSRTRCFGREVHTDAIAVAYVAQAHGAEGPSLGPSGTRPCASNHLVRTMPSQATHGALVSEAGPWGSWLSRSLPTKG
jgi:hypothetical protein